MNPICPVCFYVPTLKSGRRNWHHHFTMPLDDGALQKDWITVHTALKYLVNFKTRWTQWGEIPSKKVSLYNFASEASLDIFGFCDITHSLRSQRMRPLEMVSKHSADASSLWQIAAWNSLRSFLETMKETNCVQMGGTSKKSYGRFQIRQFRVQVHAAEKVFTTILSRYS